MYTILKRCIRRHDWFAFSIQVLMLALSLTTAYQLNLYEKRLSEESVRQSLLHHVKTENDQNLRELRAMEWYFGPLPAQLDQFVKLLGKREATGPGLVATDSLAAYFRLLEGYSYYSIRDSYLNAYLGNTAGTRVDTLTADLLRLQSLTRDLHFLWQTVLQYRTGKVMDYTETTLARFGERDEKGPGSALLRTRIATLASLEHEHTRVYLQALQQMAKIDAALAP